MKFPRAFVNAALGAAAFATAGAAQSHLEIKVHTGHGVNGYDVNSTMISGEKDMIVIDPQFTLSEAHRLAAEILESKKNLTTIYVTHPHPDHLFGLAVLKQAFPNARAVALPATADAAKTAWPARQKFWFPTYGNNIPGPDPVVPEALTTPVLTSKGEQFPITGPVQGRRWTRQQFRVYSFAEGRSHRGHRVRPCLLWSAARDKAREDWSKTIDQITALSPALIVPGHEGPGATRDMRAIQFMKKYIADWDANVASSKNASEMKTKVLAQYPGLGMEFTLNDRIKTYFPDPKQ